MILEHILDICTQFNFIPSSHLISILPEIPTYKLMDALGMIWSYPHQCLSLIIHELRDCLSEAILKQFYIELILFYDPEYLPKCLIVNESSISDLSIILKDLNRSYLSSFNSNKSINSS